VFRPLLIRRSFEDTGVWPIDDNKTIGSQIYSSGLPEVCPSRAPEEFGRVTTKRLITALQ